MTKYFAFLKIGSYGIRIFFLNAEQNKSTHLLEYMFFIHHSLQIKQSIYSIGIFRAPATTQSKVKVY